MTVGTLPAVLDGGSTYGGRRFRAISWAAVDRHGHAGPSFAGYANAGRVPRRSGLRSILPLVALRIFGPSRTLSRRPVGVGLADNGFRKSRSGSAGERRITLTAQSSRSLSGGIAGLLMGLLRMGLVANFSASGHFRLHHRKPAFCVRGVSFELFRVSEGAASARILGGLAGGIGRG